MEWLEELNNTLSVYTRRTLEIPEYRRAAVLVSLTLEANPRILLTVRTSSVSNHRGQVSFPGGKLEGFETPLEAALREMSEEVGLASTEVQPITVLSDVWTPQGFQVTPILATFHPEAVLTPSPDEVAALLFVPIAELERIEPRVEIRSEVLPLPSALAKHSGTRRVVHFDWQGVDIWGMTAHVLVELLWLWRARRPSLEP